MGQVVLRVPRSALIFPRETVYARTSGDAGPRRARAHCRVAADVAFGDVERRHGPWRATWPTLLDFASGMPLLWPQSARERHGHEDVGQTLPGGRGHDTDSARLPPPEEVFTVLPPTLTGRWATLPSEVDPCSPKVGGESGGGLLTAQISTFNSDVSAAQELLPGVDFSSRAVRERFTWAWCIVNTRCFYFSPRQAQASNVTTRDDDDDEAMVLCPFIDLFNHAEAGCEVQHDAGGFTVRADRDYTRGEELCTCYGPHGNDTLFAEYGFLLPDSNQWDSVNIDGVVLASLTDSGGGARDLLRSRGYEGGYTLRPDGVCWRTEVAARAVVMESAEWGRFVDGVWADDDDDEEGAADGPHQRARRLIRQWIEQVGREAANSLRGLRAMAPHRIRRVFWDDGEDQVATAAADEMAAARHALAVTRWEQILAAARGALETV